MKKLHMILLMVSISLSASSQNPEWTIYNTSNSGISGNNINTIVIDESGRKWIGTFGSSLSIYDGIMPGGNWTILTPSNSGLPGIYVTSLTIDANNIKWINTWDGGHARYDEKAQTWAEFDTTNSDLPHQNVTSVDIDAPGNKWIGSWGGGATKFDGISSFTTHNTSNSSIPHNAVRSLSIDDNQNIWVGTMGGGTAKFNGTNWETFNTSNSDLPGDSVHCLWVKGGDDRWFGTLSGGLAKFNGTSWTVYNTSNSGLPNNSVRSIAIDESGNIWIGTYGGGLAKFDGGTNWEVYNLSNSQLPDNRVKTIAIDESGNKWIGTETGGVAVFKKDGITPVELTSFSAIVVVNNVELSWIIETELNNLGFELFRNGNKIAFIEGKGTTTEKQEYFYKDKNLKPGIYNYRLEQIDFDGKRTISLEVTVLLTLPEIFSLEQNYPNPFNPSTTISWQVPVGSHQTLKVYDLLGREVATLVDEYKPAGSYEIQFDSSNLSSGVYIYRLTAGNFSSTNKMTLLK
jgi:streptogramin lyase